MTGREHVVSPHDEAESRNGNESINHSQIAEYRLAREGRDHLANDAKGRKDHHVDFRMTEEPEQVLKQQRIAATALVEKRRAKVTIRQQHRDGPCKDRKRQQQEKGRDQDRPDE
jgi:hypothetical protein